MVRIQIPPQKGNTMMIVFARSLLFLLICLVAHPGPCGESGTESTMYFMEPPDVAESQNVEFQVHRPFYRQPEMLWPTPLDKPGCWYMPVASEVTADRIRLWYQRIDKSEPEYVNQRVLCLAEIRGGEFSIPKLDIFPSPWPAEQNVVMHRSPHKPTWGGFNVFQIVRQPDGKYAMLFWDQPPTGEAGGMVAVSPDGLHWELPSDQAVFTEHNDAFTLIWNTQRKEYFLYQTRLEPWPDKPYPDNLDKFRRVISLRRSKDLKTWTPQETILRPDSEDPIAMEFYLMKVFPYGNRYAGLLMRYQADPDRPGKHGSTTTTEFLLSDDGIAWRRPFRDTELGFWTYADPFPVGGDLCFAAYHKAGIALHRFRRDGLVSCGTDTEGSLTTHPFSAPETPVLLNFDALHGEVAVEAINERGRTIRGFSRDRCRFVGVEGTETPLRWDGNDLSKLNGKTIRLRFYLKLAQIYSLGLY